VLQIAPSGYWRHTAHQRNPKLHCARAQLEDTLVPHIERVWQANMRVYGPDKVCRQMNREGGRDCPLHGRMSDEAPGLAGRAQRQGGAHHDSDMKASCPLDKVNRVFKAGRPNQLWVSDFT